LFEVFEISRFFAIIIIKISRLCADKRAQTMIRRFKLSDLNRILHIEAHAFPKLSYTSEMFLHYHRAFPDTFLVSEEKTVRGYIIFEPSGHVLSLAVDPAHRRKGTGTYLMKACESRCKTGRLMVELRKSNIGAKRFYQKLGFQLKSEVRLYYGTEDAHVMEKKREVLRSWS
jgi:ribosomal protein S18 acetylase RimI-like enzyme